MFTLFNRDLYMYKKLNLYFINRWSAGQPRRMHLFLSFVQYSTKKHLQFNLGQRWSLGGGGISSGGWVFGWAELGDLEQ